MDYGPRKLMTDDNDVFWIIRLLTHEVFRPRIVMIMLRASVAFHCISTFIQLYYFFAEPQLFFQYACNFFGTFYSIASGIITIAKTERVRTFWDGLERWDVSAAGPELELSIRKQIKYVQLFVHINNLLGFIAGALIAMPGSYDESFYFMIYATKRWIPFLRSYPMAVSCVFKITLMPIGYAMLVQPYLIVYAAQHIKIQSNLGQYFVRNIASGFEKFPDDILVRDEEYQNTIRRRMKFCIKRHIDVLSWGLNMRVDIQGASFVIVSVCGFILGFSIILTFLQLHRYNHDMLLISWEIVFCIVVCTSFASLIHSGQIVEEEMENVRISTMDSRWYTWNKENRKLYCTVQECFLKAFKLSFSSNYAINYNLAVSMLRGLYSITSVLITMRK